MFKALSLCLLLLLTPADDVWARATPTPDDDARAAANNDYTPPGTEDPVLVAHRPAPPPSFLPGARGPAAAKAPPGSPRPHPLCPLMPLLC